MKKIASLFPGIGYTCDKPLLYYSWKLLTGLGWETVPVWYSGFPDNVEGNAEKMQQCARMALEQAEELLHGIDWSGYFIAVPKGGAVSLSALIERALKLASVKPAYTVTYSEPNDYDTFIETDRNAAKTDRTQIRMDGNGGTVYGQENYFALVRSGSTLTLPRPDEREGFEFAGWYANALTDGAAAPNDDDLISADTQVRAEEASVYTAVWKEAK